MKLSELQNYRVVSYSKPVAPSAEKSFFDKTLDFAQTLPTAPLGNAIGRSVLGLGALARGDTDTFKRMGDENAANFGKVVGSTAFSAVTPISFAAGAAPTTLGTAAKFAGYGAAQAGAASVAQGNNATQVAKDTAIGAGIGAAAGGITSLVGKFLEKTGNRITTSVIKPGKAEIEDGFSVDTINKYNLGGSLKQSFEKTDQAMDALTQQLNAKLAASNSTINLSTVLDDTIKSLEKNSLANFGSTGSMNKAIEQLRNEVLAVGQSGVVSIPEAQVVKRASGHMGAWVYDQTDPDSTARQKVYTAFYRLLKQQIEQNAPEGVREINQELSKLIPVMNALIKRIPVAERNNALSLTDVISLAGATIDPSALTLAVVNRASKSGTVGSALTKLGQKTTGAAVAPAATSLLASSLPEQTQSTPTTVSKASPKPTTLSPEHQQAIHKAFELTEQISPGGIGGAIRKAAPLVAKKLSNIHPDDLHLMERFIDYARIGSKFSDDAFAQAEKLAQKFGISMDKGLKGIANAFEDILRGKRPAPDTVVQPRDTLGRFK